MIKVRTDDIKKMSDDLVRLSERDIFKVKRRAVYPKKHEYLMDLYRRIHFLTAVADDLLQIGKLAEFLKIIESRQYGDDYRTFLLAMDP
ncbi:MAG: hypothetical protein AB8C84_04600 [Oligoflexales bacterium]